MAELSVNVYDLKRGATSLGQLLEIVEQLGDTSQAVLAATPSSMLANARDILAIAEQLVEASEGEEPTVAVRFEP